MIIDLSADVKRAKRLVGAYQKQIPFAAARALTKTAQAIRGANKNEMKRVFRNPSRFTLNAQFIKTARKTDLEAIVGLKDLSGGRPHYLAPHVLGGSRRHTKFEQALQRAGVLYNGWFAVPGKRMPRTRSGRISAGVYQKILAQLSAYNDPHQWATQSTRSRRNRRAMAFFVNRGRQPGIMMRKGRRVVYAFVFVKSVNYKKRLDYYGIAKRTVVTDWMPNFRSSISQALRTAR